jgi:hypothetical protein
MGMSGGISEGKRNIRDICGYICGYQHIYKDGQAQQDIRRSGAILIGRIPGCPEAYQVARRILKAPHGIMIFCMISGSPGGYQETHEEIWRFRGQQSDAVDSGA